mgnify:CR=1 FL=1
MIGYPTNQPNYYVSTVTVWTCRSASMCAFAASSSGNALVTVLRTGHILPKFLESLLDAGIERLRIDFSDPHPNQLS